MLFFGGRPNTDKLKARRDVKGLSWVLGHENDPQVRHNAIKAVGQIGGPQAVKPLVAALTDNSPEVCIVAADVLTQMGTEAVATLIAELEGSQHWQAALVLGRIGDPRAVKPLVAALKNEVIRGSAVEALGMIGDVTAVEPLIAALKDDEGYVRRRAADALGKIGDKRSVEPLITTLKDSDPNVCAVAAEALGKIGDSRAVQPLVDMLDEAASKDKRGEVIPYIAKALWRLGDPRATEAFINILLVRQKYLEMDGSSRDFGAIEISADRAQRAAEILGEMRDIRAIEPLIACLKDMPSVAAAAEKALIRIGSGAVEQLIAALEDGSLSARRRAASALGQIGDIRAVEPLIEVLGIAEAKRQTDKLIKHMKKTGQLPDGWANAKPSIELEPSVACSVVAALGMLRDRRSVRTLRVIRDTTSYEDMRRIADEALERLNNAG